MEAEASKGAEAILGILPIIFAIVILLGAFVSIMSFRGRGKEEEGNQEGEVDGEVPTTSRDDRMEREIELIRKAQKRR